MMNSPTPPKKDQRELLPCPFCGHPATKEKFSGWRVSCISCMAGGSAYDKLENAIETWNTRHSAGVRFDDIVEMMCDLSRSHAALDILDHAQAEVYVKAIIQKLGQGELRHNVITWEDGSQSCGTDCKICYPDKPGEGK